MEPKQVRYAHIEEFRLLVPELEMNLRHIGCDADGNQMYDMERRLEPMRFEGTWKLHGTCAIVSQSGDGMMWTSSRRGLVTVDDDNYGFAAWMEGNREWFELLFARLRGLGAKGVVTIYGEFVGKGINNGSGISRLPRSLFIFDTSERVGEGTKIYHNQEFGRKALADVMERHGSPGVYHILDFGRPEPVILDFADKQAAADRMGEATERVAAHCPVAAAFGIDGIGEGIVWRTVVPKAEGDEVVRIKTKGNDFKASMNRAKRLVEVDPIPARNAHEFAERVLGGNRLAQGLDLVCRNDPKMSDIGEYLKWVASDIEREERDVLALMDDKQRKLSMKTAHRMAQRFFIAACREAETSGSGSA